MLTPLVMVPNYTCTSFIRYDHVKAPGSRVVGPVISRVNCTHVLHDAIAETAAAEQTAPIKVTESGRCKKKTLELKDRGVLKLAL